MLEARRGRLLLAGAAAVVLALALTLHAAGGATGADVRHCARLSAQSQEREQAIAGAGRPIVVIGDSYSVGLGLRDPAASWPSRLHGRVQVFGFSGSGFSAHASPCAGVSYAARARHALRGGADLVVVEGGLNDTDQPTAEIRAGFRALMARLAGRDVLVVGPPPAPVRAAGARRVDAILRAEAGRAGARYLSMLDRTFPYLEDHLHLTAAGHHAFGSIVEAEVAD